MNNVTSENKQKRNFFTILLSKIRAKAMFIPLGIILCIYALSLLVPFVWMFYSAFKEPIDFLLNPFALPNVWHPENFAKIFNLLHVEILTDIGKEVYGLGTMLFNSFMLSTGISLFGIMVPAITAYAVAKYNFKGKKLIYNIAIITMIIPIVGNLPSSLSIRKALGIINNPLLYILTCAQPFGFNFLLLYGMFKGISWTYAEAVFIDGGGHFTVMFKVMFPLALPTLATVFILAFIGNWNDYMTVLTYLWKVPNLAFGMYMFQNEAARYGATMPEVLAGLILAAIPSATLYLASQKLILSKFAVGGLKG